MSKTIDSVLVSDDSFRVLYEKYYKEKNDKLIMEIIEAIHMFATEKFDSKLTRIVFTETTTDIIHFKNYSFIITSSGGNNAPCNQYLDYLSERIQWYDNIIDVIEFFRTEIICNDDYPDIKCDYNELYISQAYVCEESALPISYLKLSGNDMDPMLIGPILTALTSFSNTMLKKSIEMIQIGDFRIFFNRTFNKLYLLVSKEKHNRSHSALQKRRIDNLLNIMSETIELLLNVSDEINTDDLNSIMYTFIIEEVRSYKLNNQITPAIEKIHLKHMTDLKYYLQQSINGK